MISRRIDPAHVAVTFAEVHSPLNAPRFSWQHALIALYSFGLLYLSLKAPGLGADVGGFEIFGWQTGMRIRIGVVTLMVYALIGIRGVHWLTAWSMLAAITAACLKAGFIRITHDPMDVVAFLYMVALAGVAIRVIIRQPEIRTVAVEKRP